MAWKTIDENGEIVQAPVIRMMFVCDRCENTIGMRNAMETYKLVYQDNHNDGRSFCSKICVMEVIRTEFNQTPIEVMA